MLPFLGEVWGNPSSVHHMGRRCRSFLDDARERAAAVLGCNPSELIFTSGGTESVNLAIFGAARALKRKGRHIITSAVEHHAVLDACDYLARNEGFDVTRLPVDHEGRVAPENLASALRCDSTLVSIMAANNEIGTLQPVAELGAVCRSQGVIFHTDAAQWFGKEQFESIHQFNADLVSICAHKLHGPMGAGVLFAKSTLRLEPILFGGGHEDERRAGTENLPAIIGLAAVLERFVKPPVFPRERLLTLTNRLLDFLDTVPGVQSLGSRDQRLANTVAFCVPTTDSISLLANLDIDGICASSGAACSASSPEPSHVVRALGLSERHARSLIRLSLGRETSDAEVAHFERLLPAIIHRASCHLTASSPGRRPPR
jgi:cysteine desulfurase